MAIRFSLQPNPVTPDPDDQYARVSTNDTLTADDIVKRSLRRGTTLTETDLKAAMNLLFTVIAEEVADGNAVILPLVNIRPSITGTFTNLLDIFDSSRHTKKATISPGILLNQKMRDAKVEKISSNQPMPVLLEFKDVYSGSTNKMFTGGGVGQITGSELKFDPTNVAEGVFLVNDVTIVDYKATVIISATDGKIVFRIPDALPTGTYFLEVHKAYGKAGNIRKGVLKHILEQI